MIGRLFYVLLVKGKYGVLIGVGIVGLLEVIMLVGLVFKKKW